MKKIEASLINRLLMINGKGLINLILDLSHYSLSLSITLGHLEFLGALLHWSKKGKEGKMKKISRREG